MENINTILLIYAVAASIAAVGALIVPKLKKHGVNVPTALEVAQVGIAGADQITDILKAVFPNNAVVNIADKIIDYGVIGVKKAEQLYHINEITGDERKAEAEKFVYDALLLAGVERTPAIDKIVDGSVEAAVLALGHAVDTADNGEGYGMTVAE